MLIDYMAVLGEVYPHIQAVCFGDPFDYSNIVAEDGSVLPSQAEMDEKVLERIKAHKVAELSDACRDEIISGFTSNALGQDGLYDAYEVDQLNLVGSVSTISPTPDAPDGSAMPYAVRPIVDGVVQPKVYTVHTYAQLRQVMEDGTHFKLSKLQKFNVKRDYVNITCQTHAEVDAVTWESVEPS